MRSCQQQQNLTHCTCTYEACSRRGLCCDCIAYHLENKQLPGCVFPPEVERTYDRSFERFVAVYQNQK